MSTYSSIYCPACQKHTSLEKIGGSYRGNDSLWYEIGECNSCSQRFLVIRDGGGVQIMQTHPRALPRPIDEVIPSPIKEDLEEAELCFAVGAYRAAATMARRAMQNVAIEKGAPKKDSRKNKAGEEKMFKLDLMNQIDWLNDNRIITPDLRDWAQEVRSIGNKGAHPGDAEDEEPITRDDAEQIITLANSFCTSLYVTTKVYRDRKTTLDTQQVA